MTTTNLATTLDLRHELSRLITVLHDQPKARTIAVDILNILTLPDINDWQYRQARIRARSMLAIYGAYLEDGV